MDTSCLDPRRFKELIDGGIPLSSLNNIAELAGLDATSLYVDTTTDVGIGLLRDAGEQSHHETDKTMKVDSRVVKCAGARKQCIACCCKVLHRYSLHASAITSLYLAYQYLLTHSVVFTSTSLRKSGHGYTRLRRK